MTNTPHVCQHTNKGKLACIPCDSPFGKVTLTPIHKAGSKDFNKFSNNISHIHVYDTAPLELLAIIAGFPLLV